MLQCGVLEKRVEARKGLEGVNTHPDLIRPCLRRQHKLCVFLLRLACATAMRRVGSAWRATVNNNNLLFVHMFEYVAWSRSCMHTKAHVTHVKQAQYRR
jgi:hypothetical protein